MDFKAPCTETTAVIGLLCIAAISLVIVDQPESIVVGIASGILGWLKGQKESNDSLR